MILFSAVGCSETKMVGSKFIKTQAVSAADGGTITVTGNDDVNLEGLQIQIPANALASDTTITIAEAAGLSAKQLGGATQASTTADLGPSGTLFSIPAKVTLPFSADAGSDVWVIGVEGDGTFFLIIPDGGLSVDAGLVSFPVSGFTRYAVVSHPFEGCAAGYLACDAGGEPVCVDPLSDSDNCGGCGFGFACPSGQSCVLGICQCILTGCPTDGGMICTDLENDPLNCGSCGTVCQPNENCVPTFGCQCETSSTVGFCAADGGLACVDLRTDDANCGVCGRQCADDQHCAAPTGGGIGLCECNEPDGGPQIFDNCDGICIDTSHDPRNCGACGNICPLNCIPGDAGTGVCPCPTPYTQCAPDCVDTYSDINHCGSCTNDCIIAAEGKIFQLNCNLGRCYCGPTGMGTICPGGVCALTENDPSNCGSCGFVCQAPGQDCVNGVCTCPFSESLCGSPDAGIPLFCTDTLSDSANCGVCGNICGDTYAAGSQCYFGVCACPPSSPTLCGVPGSGQCISKTMACDAGTNLPDAG